MPELSQLSKIEVDNLLFINISNVINISNGNQILEIIKVKILLHFNVEADVLHARIT